MQGDTRSLWSFVSKVNGYDGVCLACMEAAVSMSLLDSNSALHTLHSKGLDCKLPQQNECSKGEDLELLNEEGKFMWQEVDGLCMNHSAHFG